MLGDKSFPMLRMATSWQQPDVKQQERCIVEHWQTFGIMVEMRIGAYSASRYTSMNPLDLTSSALCELSETVKVRIQFDLLLRIYRLLRRKR